MNTMEVDGYKAKIEFDPDLFRGEILVLNSRAEFYGKNPTRLRRAFRNSLKVFLDVCKENDIDPTKP